MSGAATEVKRGWHVHRATVSHGLFWVEGTNYETETPRPFFWQIGEHSFIGRTRYDFSACEFGPGAKEEYMRLIRRAAAETIGRTGLRWLATECREGAFPDYLRESLDRAHAGPGNADYDREVTVELLGASRAAGGVIIDNGGASVRYADDWILAHQSHIDPYVRDLAHKVQRARNDIIAERVRKHGSARPE